jgi:monoterpene epsilon-lactone hydrolase
MPSLRGRLFIALMRNRHLFKLKLKKETGLDWETGLPQVRESAAKGARFMGRLPRGMENLAVDINGLPAEWIQSAKADQDRAILYFHGGGYVLGTIEMHRAIVAKFVKGSGVQALLFGYRLAPEHPFPAALEDALKAYAWLLDQGIAPGKIVFAGDSAGGGLCLATLLALKDQGLPLPAAAAALSPFTDLKCTGASLKGNADKCLAPPGSWHACAKHYASGQYTGQPLISPLYGDLHGLPPLLVHAGENETLRDDSVRFVEKAKSAGVDVRLEIGQGMCHCYPACAPLFPEAARAMEDICAFIKQKLAG